jgi:hypothetical protein
VAGPRSETLIVRLRDKLQRDWPTMLAALALVAGVFVVWLGVSGLTGIRGKPRCHPGTKVGHKCPSKPRAAGAPL